MTPAKRCSDCDGVLWSDESKRLGYHSECRQDPLEGDLEEQLEQLLGESPE